MLNSPRQGTGWSCPSEEAATAILGTHLDPVWDSVFERRGRRWTSRERRNPPPQPSVAIFRTGSQEGTILCTSSLPRRTGFLGALDRTSMCSLALVAEQLGRDQGAGCVAFLGLDSDEHRLELRTLDRLGYAISLEEVTFTLRIGDFECFNDYLGRLSTHRRHEIRKEMKHFRSVSDCRQVSANCLLDSAMAELQWNHTRRHGGTSSLDDIVRRHRRLVDLVPDDIAVFVSGDPPEAFSVWAVIGDRLTSIVSGFSPKEHFAYFQVGYYAPIEFAIDHRLSSIEVGPDAVEAKKRRGFTAARIMSAQLDLSRPIVRFETSEGGAC